MHVHWNAPGASGTHSFLAVSPWTGQTDGAAAAPVVLRYPHPIIYATLAAFAAFGLLLAIL